MTTEKHTSTEAAMEAARASVEGGQMDEVFERLAERLGAKASVQAVFGDPIERDGITVIPVARVRWGFGGGSGTGPMTLASRAVGGTMPGGDAGAEPGSGGGSDLASENSAMGGSGAGGGVMADPVGFLEIGPDGATYRPIINPMPSPGFLLAAGATAALVLRGVARLFRR